MKKRVAVIGGDAKKIRRHVGDDSLRYYSSSHNGGNGDAAMLTAAIRAGGVDEVWILWPCIGHPERDGVIAACRAQEVAIVWVNGPGEIKTRLAS
ncbi:MAG: hypothetical protein KC468_39215 [Myxococcales bacterium]|nr:hypothetical protein [Myxococcales bacterium]